MAKELEAIERVTSPGDLPARLEAAENATIDVEKRLAKTVRLTDSLTATDINLLSNFRIY